MGGSSSGGGGGSSSGSSSDYDEDDFANDSGFTQGFSSPSGAGNQAVSSVSPGGGGFGGGSDSNTRINSFGIPVTDITLPSGTFSRSINQTPFGSGGGDNNSPSILNPSQPLPAPAAAQLPPGAFPAAQQPTTLQEIQNAIAGLPQDVTETVQSVTDPFGNINISENLAGFQNQALEAYNAAKDLTTFDVGSGQLSFGGFPGVDKSFGVTYSQDFANGGLVARGIGSLIK